MTAAAIATMATVEAATTTRPFYLGVPGRNRVASSAGHSPPRVRKRSDG
jgi:hypothetical protein